MTFNICSSSWNRLQQTADSGFSDWSDLVEAHGAVLADTRKHLVHLFLSERVCARVTVVNSFVTGNQFVLQDRNQYNQ